MEPTIYQIHERKEQLEDTIFHLKRHFESVMDHLYGHNSLDLLALENDIDEICHLLDVEIRDGDLQIARHKRKVLDLRDLLRKQVTETNLLEQTIELSNNYLKQQH